MGLLFPVIGVAAIFLLLRGHDLPGGGFVAGITMAVAFILQYMARGTIWVEARLHVLPVHWMGFGLLLAGGTGAAAWLFGRPFLTSYFSYAEFPLIGRIPVASALALRHRRVLARGRGNRADADRYRAPVRAKPPRPARDGSRRAPAEPPMAKVE